MRSERLKCTVRDKEIKRLGNNNNLESFCPVLMFHDKDNGRERGRQGKNERKCWQFALCSYICSYKRASWFPQEGFQFSSVQLLSRVRLFATPWTAARQGSLSVTNSRSSPKLMSIESVMPFSHLILCRPLLLLGFSLSQRGFARVQTRPHLFQEFPGYPVQC